LTLTITTVVTITIGFHGNKSRLLKVESQWT